MTHYVLGVDPGFTTGLARLDLRTRHWELVQVTPGAVLIVLSALAPTGEVAALAVERFVVGARAARSSTPKAGQITRELIGVLTEFGRAIGVPVHLRPAAEVKPWATNARLAAAGVTTSDGWGHARDAARHCLFSAVHSGLLPDPLSAAYRRSPR